MAAASATAPLRRSALPSRWLLVGLVVLALVGAGAFLVSRRATTSVPAVATAAVTRGPITATVPGSGTVAPTRALDLAFQTNGTVTEVLVRDGDAVTEGQVLARLDLAPYQLKVRT